MAERTKSKIEFLIMDGGYDQLKNYESAKNIGAQAMIPVNLRNEKEPPERFLPMELRVVPWVMK